MPSLSSLDHFVGAYEEKRASKCLYDLGKHEPEPERWAFLLKRRRV